MFIASDITYSCKERINNTCNNLAIFCITFYWGNNSIIIILSSATLDVYIPIENVLPSYYITPLHCRVHFYQRAWWPWIQLILCMHINWLVNKYRKCQGSITLMIFLCTCEIWVIITSKDITQYATEIYYCCEIHLSTHHPWAWHHLVILLSALHINTIWIIHHQYLLTA